MDTAPEKREGGEERAPRAGLYQVYRLDLDAGSLVPEGDPVPRPPSGTLVVCE